MFCLDDRGPIPGFGELKDSGSWKGGVVRERRSCPSTARLLLNTLKKKYYTYPASWNLYIFFNLSDSRYPKNKPVPCQDGKDSFLLMLGWMKSFLIQNFNHYPYFYPLAYSLLPEAVFSPVSTSSVFCDVTPFPVDSWVLASYSMIIYRRSIHTFHFPKVCWHQLCLSPSYSLSFYGFISFKIF